jgi:hypothetical protein
MRDLFNNLRILRGISPLRITDNTPAASQIIDLQGQDGVLFVIAAGTLADADATFTASMTAGDAADLSDGAAVTSADDLLGTLAGASFTFAADDTVRKIGYRGSKRYVRLTLTPANNTGNADLAAIVITSPLLLPAP